VRSRFCEDIPRNRPPLAVYRSKLEERKVEVDPIGIRPKKGMKFGRDDRRVSVCVWRARCRGRWYWCPRNHPRIRVRL
jgi:hypothetical protein